MTCGMLIQHDNYELLIQYLKLEVIDSCPIAVQYLVVIMVEKLW